MVKGSAVASFRDAYLCSLRTDDFLDPPAPKSLKKRAGNKEGRNAPQPEEYASPAMQRSRERAKERARFMEGYGSPVAAKKSEPKKEKPTLDSRDFEPSSPRMKKLWDLDSPISRDEARDESPNVELDYSRSRELGDGDEGADDPVWDAARIRREARRDTTKRVKNDISEMEEFTANMWRRIQHYTPLLAKGDGTLVVVDDVEDKRRNRAGRGAADEHESVGIELRLTRTESGEEPDAKSNFKHPIQRMREDPGAAAKKLPEDDPDDGPDDDGYGKPVRPSGRKKKEARSRRGRSPSEKPDFEPSKPWMKKLWDLDSPVGRDEAKNLDAPPKNFPEDDPDDGPDDDGYGKPVGKSSKKKGAGGSGARDVETDDADIDALMKKFQIARERCMSPPGRAPRARRDNPGGGKASRGRQTSHPRKTPSRRGIDGEDDSCASNRKSRSKKNGIGSNDIGSSRDERQQRKKESSKNQVKTNRPLYPPLPPSSPSPSAANEEQSDIGLNDHGLGSPRDARLQKMKELNRAAAESDGRIGKDKRIGKKDGISSNDYCGSPRDPRLRRMKELSERRAKDAEASRPPPPPDRPPSPPSSPSSPSEDEGRGRTRASKKKRAKGERRSRPPLSPRSPSDDERRDRAYAMSRRVAYKTDRMDQLDGWWDAHKRRERRLKESEEARLEEWWRERKREEGERRRTAAGRAVRGFRELSGEPTIEDDAPLTRERSGDDVPAPSPAGPPSPPRFAKARREPASDDEETSSGGRGGVGGAGAGADDTPPVPNTDDDSSPSLHKRNVVAGNEAPPSPPAGRTSSPRLVSPSTTRGEGGATATSASFASQRSRESRSDDPGGKGGEGSRGSRRAATSNGRGRADPPRPEASREKRSTSSFRASSRASAADDGERAPPSPAPRHRGPVRTPPRPPSSVVRYGLDASSAAFSHLSDDETDDVRCQSVAQSTLAVLVSRIEEARGNFTKALMEGDVERQAELAGLMTRLGEAAVTMRKLEQIR